MIGKLRGGEHAQLDILALGLTALEQERAHVGLRESGGTGDGDELAGIWAVKCIDHESGVCRFLRTGLDIGGRTHGEVAGGAGVFFIVEGRTGSGNLLREVGELHSLLVTLKGAVAGLAHFIGDACGVLDFLDTLRHAVGLALLLHGSGDFLAVQELVGDVGAGDGSAFCDGTEATGQVLIRDAGVGAVFGLATALDGGGKDGVLVVEKGEFVGEILMDRCDGG